MKKLMRKLLAVVAAMTMVLGMSVSAFAADATATGDNYTYSAGSGAASIDIQLPTDSSSNTHNYEVYKVFDATSDGSSTNISYKLVKGKTNAPAGFTVDAAGNVTYSGRATDGNLTATDIDAIATYIKNDTAVADVNVPATTNADGAKKLTITGLDYGYYYITTATGSVVSVTSTNPKGETKDKNTVTSVDDKKVTDIKDGDKNNAGSKSNDGHEAVAELGSTVSFEATVTFGNGAKNVKFHDTMTNGLSLDKDSIKVTGLPAEATYTVKADETGDNARDDGDTFTIVFSDGIAQNAKAIITYTATVISGDLYTNPATNKAYTTYGDNNSKTEEKENKVYNATITVTKDFQGSNGNLAKGSYLEAGFVLRKGAGTAEDPYKYYQKNDNDVNWVADKSQATELKTDKDNNILNFTGLANGTYTLIENTVPDGYNKAADKTFTVEGADTDNFEAKQVANTDKTITGTNLAQATEIENKLGSALPSTGGMGTTIFYVLGAALVIGAGVVLVTRRRLSK